eukprot:366501-Chlamydomonas_euryale.AAC.4
MQPVSHVDNTTLVRGMKGKGLWRLRLFLRHLQGVPESFKEQTAIRIKGLALQLNRLPVSNGCLYQRHFVVQALCYYQPLSSATWRRAGGRLMPNIQYVAVCSTSACIADLLQHSAHAPQHHNHLDSISGLHAITLSIPHGFQCSKLCWKAASTIKAGNKSIGSPLLGAFCMGHYAVAWAALSRMGCMAVKGAARR